MLMLGRFQGTDKIFLIAAESLIIDELQPHASGPSEIIPAVTIKELLPNAYFEYTDSYRPGVKYFILIWLVLVGFNTLSQNPVADFWRRGNGMQARENFLSK
ncbi:MAG: hypothetical protein U5K54_10285 [Cytophagales bacterium]|nr:hypothetical protein [Cytophagales bacterium]